MGTCWHCDKEGVDIQMFTRVDEQICPYWDAVDITFKKCTNPKCKLTSHPIESEYCSVCMNKKGKNKGQPFKLKLCKSDKDTCQFSRNDYTKVNKEGEEDERTIEED